MKTLLTLALTLLVCTPIFAIDVDPKVDRAVRDLMPVCSDAVVKYDQLSMKLPPRFTGATVTVESASHNCDGGFAAVLAPSGAIFVGSPWPLTGEEGKTIEEKLKNFTWRNMHETMTATVDRTRNADGLFPVTLNEVTTNGKLPLAGFVDPEGQVFFFGRFRPRGEDVRTSRSKVFETFTANAPAKGAAKPVVTIVEFSDFQCPSCQRAAGYLDPILAKHGDKVRYIRYDLPLTGHNWAFGAALAGRAIYRQKPELFWDYKKQVYANQSSFNPFSFWDWARGFASDHDLDLAKYDADLESAEIKAEILNGAGTALTNDIRATPSYVVNGAIVDPGVEGKDLAEYVDKLLAK
ncbi:MAG: thioredoxin domain-containing protein [Thermoanaerobaculia bacterium]